MIVLFALVTHGENRNVARIVDLEQRHVACVAEGDDELPQQRSVAWPGLAAGKGRVLEQLEGRFDGVQGALCAARSDRDRAGAL